MRDKGTVADLERSRVTCGATGLEMVAISTGPRCLSFGNDFSIVPAGWIGSYSTVASLNH